VVDSVDELIVAVSNRLKSLWFTECYLAFSY
jgi:hypothetical protein